MNAKQAAFVREYLIDHNGARAAERAGYSRKTARQIADRLLSKVDISEAVKAGDAAAMQRAQLTQDKVVNGLLDVAENGKQESAKVAAWSWLGRSLAMFTDKQQVALETPTRIEFVRRGK